MRSASDLPWSKWVVLTFLSLLSAAPATRPFRPAQLWLYSPANLQSTDQVDRLEALWRRAAKAGYTHIQLADGKLARIGELGDVRERYRANLARLKRVADELHLKLVVSAADFGYSSALLWHDPMLAEAVPVRGTLMEAKDGVARVVTDPPVAFGKPTFVDDSVVMKEKTAEVDKPGGNARIVFDVEVSPFRCYHVRVDVETSDFGGSPQIMVLDETGRSLQHTGLKTQRTQGRRTVDVVFDSLASKKVKVYFGQWGPAQGKLVWRNWLIEEAPPVNVIRREGAKVVVRGEDGKQVIEGRDVDEIRDGLCGAVPWPGAYEAWHEPPVVRTRLPDGTRFRVDWWFPPVIGDDQVTICPGESKTWALVGRQMKSIHDELGQAGVLLGFDEIRVLGWDDACGRKKPGEILAEAAKHATALAHASGFTSLYVWSDMFDPTHNAVEKYYLVNGSLAGSWEGVARDVCVINWNFGKRAESLRFFSERGHRQVIAAYYDEPLEHVQQWLDAAADVKGVDGMMYCTWSGDYSNLETFAKLCGR